MGQNRGKYWIKLNKKKLDNCEKKLNNWEKKKWKKLRKNGKNQEFDNIVKLDYNMKIEMRTRKNSFGGVRFYFTLKIQKVV